MPLPNRVTPFGEIVAVPARGTLMGNRGILHNADRVIVRDWQVRRWIACRLEFRGRHRQVMAAHSYTELFFLDEAAALAEGHRPCAECRNADYRAFQAAWRRAYPRLETSAEAMDAVLHADRRAGQWLKRTYVAPVGSLPDGTYVEIEGRAWLARGSELIAWSAEGYQQHLPRGSRDVRVLTPRSMVAVLEAGYQAGVHPSAAM